MLKPIYDNNSTLTRNKSTTSIDSLQIQIQQQHKGASNQNQHLLSLVLKAEPMPRKMKTSEQIHFFKSQISSVETSSTAKKTTNVNSDAQHPDDNVLFNFILNDLKKQLLETSIKSSFLNLNIICKVFISLLQL